MKGPERPSSNDGHDVDNRRHALFLDPEDNLLAKFRNLSSEFEWAVLEGLAAIQETDHGETAIKRLTDLGVEIKNTMDEVSRWFEQK